MSGNADLEMPAGMLTDLVPGRRGEILEAGLAVFAEKGYDRGSMRDIAERVGVSEPALYRHFAGKEELFLTLVRLTASTIVDQVARALESIGPSPGQDALREVLEERVRVARSYFPVLRTLLIECLRRPQFLAAWRDEVAIPLSGRVQDMIARGDESFGRASDEEDRRQRARLLIAMFLGYQVTSLAFAEDDLDALTALVFPMMGWR